MTSNIGPVTTTPDPSIHSVPAPDSPNGGGLNFGQIEAIGQFLLTSFIAQVAIAFGGISILGFDPLSFLVSWGQNLENQASQAYEQALTATTTAQAATTVQAQQSTAKPGYLALDATADAVFPISQISGSTPTTVALSNADSVIGFINTPDNGKKSSVVWLGETTTGLTDFRINVYQLNTTSGLLTLLEASTNQISSVSNVIDWNYYDLTTPLTSQVGNWYAVELCVAGSGTYQVAGLPSHWLPPNSTTPFPQQMAATRSLSGGITAPSTFTPVASQNVPWAGLAGFAFGGPTTTPFPTAGTFTYTIPSWMKWGDNIDVVIVPAGGGGQASTFFLTGAGGSPGTWVTRTLVYGVDIPITTTTLTVIVGAGGSAGSGAGTVGGNGGTSSAAGTGVTTVTAVGGVGGSSGGVAVGPGPGNKTYDTVTYTGGADAGASAPGNAPGGAGGGGAPYSDGAAGAPAEVWLAAYQAGTTP
jgi:hypothetical protein